MTPTSTSTSTSTSTVLQFGRVQAVLAAAAVALLTQQAGAQTAAQPPAQTAAPTQTLAPPVEGCATVEVHGVRPQQGRLMVVAFDSALSYRKTPLTQLQLPAGEAMMQFQLCGLGAAQELALTLFQDLDSDGRMGANLVGLPTEPWGSSGSAGMFGPTWESGRVKLDGHLIVVRMSQ